MNTVARILAMCALVCMIFLFPQTSQATHIAGADLTYTCLGGNQYEIRLVWYRDCAGISAPTSEVITLTSASLNASFTITVTPEPGTGQEITIPCNNSATTCSGGSTQGIQEWVYTGTVTLPAAATDWVFSARRIARNTVITNVDLTTATNSGPFTPGSNGPGTYVEATLDNVNAPCNSSPFFTNEPISFLCANQTFNYNQGVVDIDGDSLVFTLIPPKEDANSDLVYFPPFNFQNPLTSVPPITFNSSTGTFTASPTQQEVTVLAVLAEEYRNGILIGSVIRDIQVFVVSCSNDLPEASGIDGSNRFEDTVCAGSQFCFDILTTDSDAGDVVTLTWNQGIAGGTFNTSGGNRPTGTFCWTPTQNDVGPNPKSFTVTVQDDACPTAGVQVYSFSILVQGLDVDLGPDQVVCATSLSLSPTINNGLSPFTYDWTPAATTPSINVTQTGTYSVTVTDADGCTGDDDVNITINPNSNLDLIAYEDTTVCPGIAVTLDAGPGFITYAWSTQANTQSITTSAPGLYTVTATDQDGCQAVDTVELINNNTLSVDIGPNLSICQGESETLDAGAGFASYDWSTAAITQTISVSQSGVYAVTVSDANGCTASDNLILNVAALPNVNLGPDIFTCRTPLSIGVLNPQRISYLWNNNATGSLITVNTGGTYSVTGTNGAGCTASDDIVITVGNAGNLDLIPFEDTTICDGSSVTLDAGVGFTSYLWSTQATTQTITTSSAGVYVVEVSDTFACVNIDTVEVIVAPNPEPDLGPDLAGCADPNASVTLDPGAGYATYDWSTNETTPTIVPTTDGTFSVTVTDQNGCVGADTIELTAFPLPVVDLGPDVAICDGDSVTLVANGGLAGYEWNTNDTTQTITVGAGGDYSVTVVDSNGCSSADTINVRLNALPEPDLGADTSVCEGEVVPLDAGAGYTSYIWSTGETTQTIIATVSGTYCVTVSDSNFCEGVDCIDIVVNDNPEPDLGPDQEICISGGSITLDAGAGFVAYDWNTGDVTQTINVDSSGTFIVTVTDQNGCVGSDTVEIDLSTLPDPGLPDDAVLCAGDSLILEAAAGFTSYVWSTQATSQSIVVTAPGVYIVTIIDSNGCTNTDTTEVREVEVEVTVAGDATCLEGSGTASTTVTGGDAPYTYDWTGPGGFSSNDMNLTGLDAGTYDVIVTDANGCSGEGTVIITLDSVEVDAGPDTVTICLGDSVQLNATGADFYIWDPSGTLTADNIADPVAFPTTTTTYVVTGSVIGGQQIVNGDFEQGNTGFTSDYDFTATDLVPEGRYAVVTDPNPLHNAFQGSDHTTGQGLFMAVNGSTTPGDEVWCQTVPVTPGQDYAFSTWISTLVANSPAELEFTINGQSVGNVITAPPVLNNWIQFFTTWNSGSDTTADICIVNQNTIAGGNDFGLDDISFAPVCQQEDSITVVVSPGPNVNLGPDDTICTGSTFVLDAGPGASYFWSDSSTGQTLAVDAAGTYSVTVVDASGCEASDTIVIATEICCFPENFGPIFTVIDASNNVVSADQVWSGKYYVTTNVFVTGTATLDLTNVDVVFFQGTGIIFQNGSRVRANNSVFRPCDFNETWMGFDFLDDSYGVINESTFKNARIAMDVKTNLNINATNNEILNANIGINFDNAGAGDYQGSATGNTFVVTNLSPAYFDTLGNLQSDFFAVKSFNTTFSGIISQNDFINSWERTGSAILNYGTAVLNYYGVYINNSAVSASKNNFTNMYRAFDVTGNGQSVTIENNEIENNARTQDSIYAIRITDVISSPVLVEGNTINFSSEAISALNIGAVYVDNASGVIISNNEIDNWAFGVRIGGGSSIINILDNEISDASDFGILVLESEGVRITKNKLIDMGTTGIHIRDARTNIGVVGNQIQVNNYNQTFGIRYIITSGTINSNNILVADNCVNDAATAMQFRSDLAPDSLSIPVIRNNYLYNYQDHGLWSANFTGSVGSCLNYPVDAGRNSFVSNFLMPFGTAVDVRSDNSTLLMMGNSANLVVTFPSVLVNTSCNTTSNTACGNQIGNNEEGGRLAGPLTELLLFKEMIEGSYPLTWDNYTYTLNNDYVNEVNAVADADRLDHVLSIMNVLYENETTYELDQFYNNMSNITLDNNGQRWVDYTYNRYMGNHQVAMTYLNMITPAGVDEADLKTVEAIRTQLDIDGRFANELTEAELQVLHVIDDSERHWAAIARDMIHTYTGLHDYQFKFDGEEPFDDYNTAEDQANQLGDDFISIYPNPVANGEVTIEFYTENTEDVEITVTDALGRIIIRMPIEYNNGSVKLDASPLANGAYVIAIIDGKSVVARTKLVKY